MIGCGEPPTADELSSWFYGSESLFNELAQSLKTDIGDRDCLTIGHHVIQNYSEYEGEWGEEGWRSKSNNKNKLNLNDVLGKVGITDERYEYYTNLFTATNIGGIRYCQRSVTGPFINIHVYVSGLAISGCSAYFWWRPQLPESTGKRGDSHFQEITPLKDGWYSSLSCY